MIIDILFIIVLLLIILINILFRSVVKTIKNIKNETGLSGFEIAKKLSTKFCGEEPHIIVKSPQFLDYYDKERNTIKLSKEVFDGENIYASIVAINIALETNKERKNVVIGRKLNSFLVIICYLFIILGAFVNNISIIHLGLIIFILTFIIEFVLLATFFISEEELNKLCELIKKEKLLKPINEYKSKCLLIALSRIATLPYNFIVYFR